MNMEDTTDHLLEVLRAYYTREINDLLVRTTDQPNATYGWLTQFLEEKQFDQTFTLIGFEVSQRPMVPKVLFLTEFERGRYENDQLTIPFRIGFEALSIDTLRNLRRHLLLPDILSNDQPKLHLLSL